MLIVAYSLIVWSRFIAHFISPHEVFWEELSADQPPLALFEEAEDAKATPKFRVPKEFLNLATRVACHRDPRRWALLYQALWRLTHGEPKLLEILVTHSQPS